jgi:hypothetical protein
MEQRTMLKSVFLLIATIAMSEALSLAQIRSFNHGPGPGVVASCPPEWAACHHHLGSGLFEPADAIFWETVRREDPELCRSIKPWSKIFEPDALRALLLECGVSDPEVVVEPGWHPLRAPEDWWTIVLGSGYRSTVDALSPQNRERVRSASIDGV